MARLIAIEGIDGSGKGTQAALLCESLQRQGRRVRLISFPRYEHTRFGAAIGEFLNGRFGSLDAVHPKLAALLFAGDRFESRDLILDAAAESEIVVFDRYIGSNIAHQAAKRPEPERSELCAWIESIEYGVYRLPQTDLTFLLDLPVDAARQLIRGKARRTYTDQPADLQEADGEYLERVRCVYHELAERNPTWVTIDCVDNGAVRSIENIAAQLQSLVDAMTDRR